MEGPSLTSSINNQLTTIHDASATSLPVVRMVTARSPGDYKSG